ncbi:CapA family protein [Enterococcus innesii]|uniref:CapA family protein n=1 Tax=Enterococcus innesii TaxID=2839759 RepID=UPI0020906E4F|nr:CapA family protein [Enterococcus innesii]MCO5496168.1 CapA family protein [Enterococcus innesii]
MRQQRRQERQKRQRIIAGLSTALLAITLGVIYLVIQAIGIPEQRLTAESTKPTKTMQESSSSTETKPEVKTITVTASGDMLYHTPVYLSAYDGKRYDFDNDFEQVKPLIASADLALGDFEGTINPNKPLGGFPLFNAPIDAVASIKDAGFDVIDLAHNHILDTGIEGIKTTAAAFHDQDLATIGVTVDNSGILVKEVNGIKVALLAYAYGFNGLEESLTQAEYDTYLKDLSLDKVEAEIKEAESLADITIVMPQSGVEYSLEPTEEQQTVYRKMIDFGADIIFGGHPHVAEPTEIIEKDGEKKFIIYSMGNLLSNQRYETVNNNYWTERGVIPEVEISKEGQRTYLSQIALHPTWVSKEPIPDRTYYDPEYGVLQAFDFQVCLAEDYLPDGRYAKNVPEEKRQRIETAYHEMLELLDLKWEQ